MAAWGSMVISSRWSRMWKKRLCHLFYMHEQRHVFCWPEILLWTILLCTKLIARPGMSDLQLFPVSSLLIGSTLLVNSIADGAPALIQLERNWVWAPGEPDCACLFRLLDSILCSIREDSCYYNCVLFSSSISSFSIFLEEGTSPLGNPPSLRDYILVLGIPSDMS